MLRNEGLKRRVKIIGEKRKTRGISRGIGKNLWVREEVKRRLRKLLRGNEWRGREEFGIELLRGRAGFLRS